MLDVMAMLTIAALFGVAALYTSGCSRLKGNRP